MQNIKCDECAGLYPVNIKTRVSGDIATHYFQCPHCKHETIAYRTDSFIRNLQQRQRDLQRDAKAKGLTPTKRRQFEQNAKQIKRRIRKLKHS